MSMLNDPEENAMTLQPIAQIRERGCDAPCRADSRHVWLVGLSFDRATRQLVGHQAERA